MPPFLTQLANFCSVHPGLISEVLLIDDGSSDGTAETAKKMMSRLPIMRVVSHEKNKGKGAAVQTGVLEAKGDYIVFMDADGATSPDELPALINALQGTDIVVGNRFLPGAHTERHSPLRQLSGFMYRMYMKLLGLGNIDTMCGFKGYRQEVARNLFTNLLEERWLFDTEVAYKSVHRKFRTVNLPIRWESKDGSKLPTRTLIKSAFQIWPLIQRIKHVEPN